MKFKICQLCKVEGTTMYRIQISKNKVWIFVCKPCCTSSQKLDHYSYGGTWKGERH